ncbi:hypothetical protein PC116_g30063 [Phytophthora cactorum]|nr:hypothetical protein PC116_g30063 [Phytophthora cactorum]
MVQSLVRGPCVYTEHETSDLDVFDNGLSLNDTDSKHLRAAHERASRLHFAKIVQKFFDYYKSPCSPDKFLGGTTKEFQAKLALFESNLKVHMADLSDFAFEKE